MGNNYSNCKSDTVSDNICSSVYVSYGYRGRGKEIVLHCNNYYDVTYGEGDNNAAVFLVTKSLQYIGSTITRYYDTGPEQKSTTNVVSNIKWNQCDGKHINISPQHISSIKTSTTFTSKYTKTFIESSRLNKLFAPNNYHGYGHLPGYTSNDYNFSNLSNRHTPPALTLTDSETCRTTPKKDEESDKDYYARRGTIEAGRVCIKYSHNDKEYIVANINPTGDTNPDYPNYITVTLDNGNTRLIPLESIGTIVPKESAGGRRRLRKTKRGRLHRTKRSHSRK